MIATLVKDYGYDPVAADKAAKAKKEAEAKAEAEREAKKNKPFDLNEFNAIMAKE